MSLTPSVFPAQLQTTASCACKCCAKCCNQVEPKIVFPSVSFVFFPFRQMLAVGTQPRTPTATLATTEGSRPSLMTGATPAGAGEESHFPWLVSSGRLQSLNLPLWPLLLRFDHSSFSGGGGGGGNTRWVEEARDDGDWSKPTPRNERLEQWDFLKLDFFSVYLAVVSFIQFYQTYILENESK